MERRQSQQSNQQSTCARCGCSLEADRVIRRNTRYCRACGPLARREKSAEWKRAFRAIFGWRKYHDDYSPFADEAAERSHRAEYMRGYRKRKRKGSDDSSSSYIYRSAIA
jgi:hypothetical protein